MPLLQGFQISRSVVQDIVCSSVRNRHRFFNRGVPPFIPLLRLRCTCFCRGVCVCVCVIGGAPIYTLIGILLDLLLSWCVCVCVIGGSLPLIMPLVAVCVCVCVCDRGELPFIRLLGLRCTCFCHGVRV